MPWTLFSSTLFPNSQTVSSPNYDRHSFTRKYQKLTKFWCCIYIYTHIYIHIYIYILLVVFPINKRTRKIFCTERYAAIPPVKAPTQIPLPSSPQNTIPPPHTHLHPIYHQYHSICSFCPPFCSPYNYFSPHSVRHVPRQTSFWESLSLYYLHFCPIN